MTLRRDAWMRLTLDTNQHVALSLLSATQSTQVPFELKVSLSGVLHERHSFSEGPLQLAHFTKQLRTAPLAEAKVPGGMEDSQVSEGSR